MIRLNKVVKLMWCYLIPFSILWGIKFSLDSNTVIFRILDNLSKILFPTAVFCVFTNMEYNNLDKKIGLKTYYSKVFLNVILPFFLYMIPYMVYSKFLGEKLFENHIGILLLKNINPQFECIRILIVLLLIYPLFREVKKYDYKKAIPIVGLISFAFYLFDLNIFVKYLIFMTMAIFAANYNPKVRQYIDNRIKNDEMLVSSLLMVIILTTISTFNKIILIKNMIIYLYCLTSVVSLFLISAFSLRHYIKTRFFLKFDFIDNLKEKAMFFYVSVFLLFDLVFKVIKNVIPMIDRNVLSIILLALSLIIFFVGKHFIDVSKKKHITEPPKQNYTKIFY